MQPTDERPETEPTEPVEHGANPGFALGQLAAALAASQGHADPKVRERAKGKARKWVDVLAGMLSGALRIGERTPMADVPAWATPEVIHGGFATGALLAGDPLRPHEQALLDRAGGGAAGTPRARLNAWYLTEAGFAELRTMLATGYYRVEVPEEAALLAVAWLAEHGAADAARRLLDEIAPHFPTLRFYPVPAARPLAESASVHLQTAGDAAAELRALRDPAQVLAQREAVLVWAPLADRAVSLFLETVEGPVPTLARDQDGRTLRAENGAFQVQGGWPCQHYPEGWAERAQALLSDYARLRREHRLSASPDRASGSFATLRRYLERCANAPASLTGRDVGRVRLVLAGIVTRRGVPGSPPAREMRQRQRAGAAAPTRTELARVVAGRLEVLDPEVGVASPDALLAPVAAGEAGVHGVAEGTPVAPRLARRLRRVQSAPVETLVERGVISSGEALARVVPAIVAPVLASGLADAALRRLYAAVYRAFRRRRSLLLLNLERQVRLRELPWVAAMEAGRQAGAADAARQALERVATLAITSFPQQIIPNKLLQEVRALAAEAGLQLPLVDELAADIFMGAFTPNFLHAAQAAARMLEGTLYERYYAIPFARVAAIDDVKASVHRGAPTSAAFLALCEERAEPGTPDGSWVARNGAVVEQSQILTTHNLAVLFALPGVAEAVRPRLGELARGCFTWICRRLQQPAARWQTRLRVVKNAAYAWRQMVFFLSHLPPEDARAFLAWAREHLNAQPHEFRQRFHPALGGLARALDGADAEDAADRTEARRFLGWSPGGAHWLLV